MPPGLRAVSHAVSTPSRMPMPQTEDRLLRTICAPRSLATLVGRYQVVDDVRRDQDQQIAPVLIACRKTEQFADDRQIYKKRDAGLGSRDLSHRKSANYGRLTIIHQQLVVGLLGLERE